MTAPGVVMRRATAGDAAALAAIGSESFRAAYQGTADDADLFSHIEQHFGLAAIEQELAAADSNYLLATVDGLPAAFVKFRRCAPPLVIPPERTLELQQAYVLPDHQRRGVGGRLVSEVVNIARGEGADGLWLSVWEAATWAINAYRKQGFEIAGNVDFRLGRTTFTDFLMWRTV